MLRDRSPPKPPAATGLNEFLLKVTITGATLWASRAVPECNLPLFSNVFPATALAGTPSRKRNLVESRVSRFQLVKTSVSQGQLQVLSHSGMDEILVHFGVEDDYRCQEQVANWSPVEMRCSLSAKCRHHVAKQTAPMPSRDWAVCTTVCLDGAGFRGASQNGRRSVVRLSRAGGEDDTNS
jgi:hypothetical protein